MPKTRLDLLLTEKGFFESRTQAQAAILAGQIYVDGQKSDKAGAAIDPAAKVEFRGEKLKYVSRGGLKLEKALHEFKVNPDGRVCLDIGASTGGFTDCLLQNGAKLVYAVDVGRGQLAWKLRQDPRVKVIEKTNARYLLPENLYPQNDPYTMANLAVMDVSFISLGLILPPVWTLLETGSDIIVLIKPQFEASKKQVGRGGIIKDPVIHQQVIEKVLLAAKKIGFQPQGVIDSPITGADGNKEFLAYFKK